VADRAGERRDGQGIDPKAWRGRMLPFLISRQGSVSMSVLPFSASGRVALSLAVAAALLIRVDAQNRPADASGEPAPETAERAISIDGRQRTYEVHDFARDRVPAAVVIMLHGGGGNADNAVRMSGFDRVAARERLLVVYPNGTSGATRAGRFARAVRDRNLLLTWNAGHCCAAAMTNRVDDVAFIGAIIDALVMTGRADESRIYVTGMSNGAMLAHRVGRELSKRIAAIAPVVGAVFGDEPAPQAPVPAFVIVGAEDQIVPPAGGPLQLRLLLGNASAADRDVAPALDQATYWARHNGCDEPVRRESDVATTVEWTTCRSGAPVIFQSVKGNGHAWPGGQAGRRGAAQPTRSFDATEAMWTFFSRHRRER
jgi:polyhydroxybutyrate depolymerase